VRLQVVINAVDEPTTLELVDDDPDFMAMDILDIPRLIYSGKYVLEIRVFQAIDLIAADLGGTSDPYLKVSLGDYYAQTDALSSTLSPKWNTGLVFSAASPHPPQCCRSPSLSPCSPTSLNSRYSTKTSSATTSSAT
jgi:hypothetical protein